jgi:hypothetical protein
MGPGRPTKVLGKRSVPVELDYSITPGDWNKPLYGVLFGLWPHTTPSPQTNKFFNGVKKDTKKDNLNRPRSESYLQSTLEGALISGEFLTS